MTRHTTWTLCSLPSGSAKTPATKGDPDTCQRLQQNVRLSFIPVIATFMF